MDCFVITTCILQKKPLIWLFSLFIRCKHQFNIKEELLLLVGFFPWFVFLKLSCSH